MVAALLHLALSCFITYDKNGNAVKHSEFWDLFCAVLIELMKWRCTVIDCTLRVTVTLRNDSQTDTSAPSSTLLAGFVSYQKIEN